MLKRKLAIQHALDVRKCFYKYTFHQVRNDKGFSQNSTDGEFIMNNGGTCRDFVRQQAKFLKRRKDAEYMSLLLIVVDSDGKWIPTYGTHAFTAVYGPDGSVYVPECILDSLKGVWYFPTIEDCISAVCYGMGFYQEKCAIAVYEYIGDDDHLVGMNRLESVEYIMAHGLELEIDNEKRPAVYEGMRIGG